VEPRNTRKGAKENRDRNSHRGAESTEKKGNRITDFTDEEKRALG